MRVSIVLVACTASQPAPPAQIAGRSSAPAAPRGAAPTIRYGDFEFDLSQLPAVARSGDRVVLGLVDYEQTGRNLRLETRDRADHILVTHVVMKAAEHARFFGDGTTPSAELQHRIAIANRTLADLHAQHDLVVMKQIDADTPAFRVAFDADHVVRVTANGKQLAMLDGRRWQGCGNHARLENVFKADAIDVVVVELGYLGDASCDPPPDEVHVIAW
jgi:hypothetical protein